MENECDQSRFVRFSLFLFTRGKTCPNRGSQEIRTVKLVVRVSNCEVSEIWSGYSIINYVYLFILQYKLNITIRKKCNPFQPHNLSIFSVHIYLFFSVSKSLNVKLYHFDLVIIVYLLTSDTHSMCKLNKLNMCQSSICMFCSNSDVNVELFRKRRLSIKFHQALCSLEKCSSFQYELFKIYIHLLLVFMAKWIVH